MIVAVEDSVAMQKLLAHALAGVLGDVLLVTHDTMMSAAADVPNASGVIIDWRLADGVTASDAGAVRLLRRRGIPFVVFTGSPNDVPDDIGCPVIDKSEIGRLVELVRVWLTRKGHE